MHNCPPRFKREPLTLFAKCGMLLFGDLYVSQFAEHLGVSTRAVQRWSSGNREMPPEVWLRVLPMLEREKKLLLDTADEVEEVIATFERQDG